MAFFNFRKAGADPVASAAQPESVEALRKRAKQRLIGSAVLVLAGVIGFPLVFDTQPRPIAVDIPIDIPDRGKSSAATNSAVGSVSATASSTVAAQPVFVAPVAEPVAPPAAQAPPPSTPPVAAAAPAAAVASAPAADGERAKALLEGKSPAGAAQGRFVVQVGAFADNERASVARLKLEKAGLKTYTQVAETKEGKRIRVRLGPFESRAEADKAAAKVKGLDLPAAVLAL
jgi:DedD protein